MKLEYRIPSTLQKKEEQRITQITRIPLLVQNPTSKVMSQKIFVQFVLFVVKKWGFEGKTRKNYVLSVVKS